MVKKLPANTGEVRKAGFIPASGRSPGGGQPSSIPAWRMPWQGSLVGCRHRVAKSWTPLKRLNMHAHTRFSKSLLDVRLFEKISERVGG